MSKCTSIDPLVTPYVDGELPAAERTLVDEHLHRCPPCHSRVAAESAVRELMRARKPGLTVERASAGLHAQCTELVNRRGDASGARLPPGVPRSSPAHAVRLWWDAPWPSRVVPLALTASLVLLVGGAFLYLATQYSARLLAAELVRGSREMLRRQQPVGDARGACDGRTLDAVRLWLASASARAVRYVGTGTGRRAPMSLRGRQGRAPDVP